MYELVLPQLGPAESSSVIKSETDMLAETHAHTRAGNWGVLLDGGFCLLPGLLALLWDSHLPTACVCLQWYTETKHRVHRDWLYTVSSTEALASVFHFGQSNRFHSGFVDSFLQTSQKRATTFFREGLWIRHVSRTWCSVRFMSSICCGQHVSALLATSHRWGEACEGFSSFGPTLLVASRAYVTFVFLESFLETCLHLLLRFRLDFGISRAMLWLEGKFGLHGWEGILLHIPHEISGPDISVCIQGGELIPVLLPVFIFLMMVFLRTGKWIEWMNEPPRICLIAFKEFQTFSRC